MSDEIKNQSEFYENERKQKSNQAQYYQLLIDAKKLQLTQTTDANLIQSLNLEIKQLTDTKQSVFDYENFVNVHQQATQAKQLSEIINGLIFSEYSTSYLGVDKYLINKLFDYELLNEPSFNIHYWYLINREWGAWWANYLCDNYVKVLDFNVYHLLKEVARYGVLFGKSGIYSDGNELFAVVKVSQERDKVKLVKTNLITTDAFNLTNSLIKFQDNLTFDATLNKDYWEFQPRNYGVGDYITLIPYLGKIIYFQQQMDRNLQFLTILPNFKSGDNKTKQQGAKAITNPWANEIHAGVDSQIKLNSAPFDFITPPESIKSFYDVMSLNIKTLKENMYSSFGRPINNSSNQDLNANVNMVISSIEYVNKEVMDNWIMFIKTLESNSIIKINDENINKETIQSNNESNEVSEKEQGENGEVNKETRDNNKQDDNTTRNNEQGEVSITGNQSETNERYGAYDKSNGNIEQNEGKENNELTNLTIENRDITFEKAPMEFKDNAFDNPETAGDGETVESDNNDDKK